MKTYRLYKGVKWGAWRLLRISGHHAEFYDCAQHVWRPLTFRHTVGSSDYQLIGNHVRFK